MTKHTTAFDQLQFEFPEAKLCECGCGLPAPVAKQTDTRSGHIKGKPMRFILGHAQTISVEERFWSFVDKSGDGDSCWLWTGAKSDFGYGRIKIDGKDTHANRLSWELHYGPIEGGLRCLHRCDNPPCVNPAHLFLGTNADNSADMVFKDRHTRGSRHPHAKLSENDVADIRRLFRDGEMRTSLARRYGVSISLVCKIVARLAWKHVP